MQETSKSTSKAKEDAKKQKFIEDVVKEVENDFIERQKERLSLERQWELNLNFLVGNQYMRVNGRGVLDQAENEFYWQNREVYNHIAPIIEARLSKFSRISPTACVRPYSDDDKDIMGANTAEKLLEECFKRNDIDDVVNKVTVWSETCGTGFYKVVWNNMGGNVIGKLDEKEVREGSVQVLPVSPFEIFPDSLNVTQVNDCQSIIHARAMSVLDIYRKYNVKVDGEDVDVFNLTKTGGLTSQAKVKNTVKNSAIVIERYEQPTSEFPLGRLITVSNGKLLYYGDLPYVNMADGKRGFPFVKQESVFSPSGFFGTSIIERLIPVQRAYNAVKNRKHEFLNRLSLGVITVEDGSVDVEDLADNGLSPGKIVVYRQGSSEPKIMNQSTMPSEFSDEEEKLLKEFIIISGVSDVASSEKNASLSGASALKLLIEQDNERMVTFAENIRKSYVNMAKQVIRLYAQFITGVKAVKTNDNLGKIKIIYADKNAFRSDDVYLENDNEMMQSLSERKETVYELYKSGMLFDENGKLDDDIKSKVLSILGYKDLDNRKGLYRLQEERAQRENEKIRVSTSEIEEFDDHKIHVFEHTKYVLGELEQLNATQKQRFSEHIKEHKAYLEQQNQSK